MHEIAEKKYKYWNDGEYEIRTCNECKFSEIKSGDKENDWVSYLTREKINFNYEYFKKYNRFPDCKTCKAWMKDIKSHNPYDKYGRPYEIDDSKDIIYEHLEAFKEAFNSFRKFLEDEIETLNDEQYFEACHILENFDKYFSGCDY